ncbi:M20 metallopeptidase family protein [Clostridium oryzae]|nr:M20 family metallopeptidase [Clostridium oryzae]
MDFLAEALKIKNYLIDWRRDFHMHPEIDYDLIRTSKKIKEFLDFEHIPYTESAKTGICAIIRGDEASENSRTIGIRADMDALPLRDRKICEYSSKVEGKMHGCGHDAHMSILMGAAKILNGLRHELKGNVKLFFEPAEETTGGAAVMIKEGVLQNPEVDAVIGLHVAEGIECGKIGIKRGVVHAASNPFEIKIIGKGGHGAHPEDTIDPVVIASNVVLALQSIVSRELPPVDAAVITVGSIQGGSAENIIPEDVVLKGTIRTMKKEHRQYVTQRVKEVTEGIVKAMRGSCEITIRESYPCLYNDDGMLDFVEKRVEDIVSEDNIERLTVPNMGVESFAYFSMEKPSAFYFLGAANEEKGINHPAHGSYFDIDENCLPIGVAIQCKTAYDYLNKK